MYGKEGPDGGFDDSQGSASEDPQDWHDWDDQFLDPGEWIVDHWSPPSPGPELHSSAAPNNSSSSSADLPNDPSPMDLSVTRGIRSDAPIESGGAVMRPH